jgi:hypothetical protein
VLGQARDHTCRRARAGGRKIDEDLGTPSRGDAGWAKRFALDILGLGQAEEDDIRGIGNDMRRIHPRRAARDERCHRLVANIVDRETMAGIDQAIGHRPAHIAEADKADFFAHRCPPATGLISQHEA